MNIGDAKCLKIHLLILGLAFSESTWAIKLLTLSDADQAAKSVDHMKLSFTFDLEYFAAQKDAGARLDDDSTSFDLRELLEGEFSADLQLT
jgi:hypothetical protein